MLSECQGCLAAFLDIAPLLGVTPDFNTAAFGFCQDPGNVLGPGVPGPPFDQAIYNLTDGLAIFSKTEYPIINTWTFDLPTWLFVAKTLNVAEINICSETDPTGKDPACSDSIIVGCVYLETTDHLNDVNVLQSPRLDRDDITSHLGLNRYQMEGVVDVFNDNILTTLGREDNADNIHGVFMMGDTNNGQLFSRCDIEVDIDGDGTTDGINADNCVSGVDEPLNPFDLFEENDFIDGPDIDYHVTGDKKPKCTFCIDPSSNDFNPLSLASNTVGDFITDPDVELDLDHILVQNGYCQNFKDVIFNRIFEDKVACPPPEIFSIATGTIGVGDCPDTPNDCTGTGCGDDQLCCDDGCDGTVCVDPVPASDHYGVSLKVKFKNNAGGRKDKEECTKNKQKSRSSSSSD